MASVASLLYAESVNAYTFALGATPVQDLLAGDATDRDAFGFSVAIDGDTAVIGAPSLGGRNQGIGVAYVHEIVPTPENVIRIEAEGMRLDTYRIEALDFASRGALINLRGFGLNGSATRPFPGSNGDEIRIDGLQDHWDHASVDYIEFISVP